MGDLQIIKSENLLHIPSKRQKLRLANRRACKWKTSEKDVTQRSAEVNLRWASLPLKLWVTDLINTFTWSPFPDTCCMLLMSNNLSTNRPLQTHSLLYIRMDVCVDQCFLSLLITLPFSFELKKKWTDKTHQQSAKLNSWINRDEARVCAFMHVCLFSDLTEADESMGSVSAPEFITK